MNAPSTPDSIALRPTSAPDLAFLHSLELDEPSNSLAATKPRDWPTFLKRWEDILADTDHTRTLVIPRVIIADGQLVGAVNIAPHEGRDSIGYWIDRAHWGRGIASRAVALMLHECTRRPLIATTAATNAASIRVLAKNGFVIESTHWTAETTRTLARKTMTLRLG